MNYAPSLGVLPTLNPKQLYCQYVDTLSDQKVIFDLQNAVVRYFVPSLAGPVPAAQKGKRLSPEDIQAGLNFLETLSLDAFSNAPDVAVSTLDKLGSSRVQTERVRRSLRDLVDWAVLHDYLDPPENPIPEGICQSIQVGQYAALPLKQATVRQICEEYLAHSEPSEKTTDTQNAIVRFFVPGCGGPRPLHKPAREFEVQAALSFLETVPLEYLDAAASITTQVMQALDISQTQQTRIRKALRDLLQWARQSQYLPHLHSVTPWGQPCLPQAPLKLIQSGLDKVPTLFDYYELYAQDLESNGQKAMMDALQSAIGRYFVPACGGPRPAGNKATYAEVQAALDYLKTLTVAHLTRADELLETEFDRLNLDSKKRSGIRLHVRRWTDWASTALGVNCSSPDSQPEPIFNTFRSPGTARPRRKPGTQMQAKRCSDYALCAKKFPNDYMNPTLQHEINEYRKWRLENNVNIGGYQVEAEQILQVMGWLHRYEGVPLEELSFEKLITKSQLIFQVKDYRDFNEYWTQKEKGLQEARTQADQDLERVKRYLNFVGGHPRSVSRRVFIALTIAKFVYKDVLGTDEFPDAKNIPVLRRLLSLQVEKKELENQALPTIPYSETSVSWEEIVQVMEHRRFRAEQTITYARAHNSQGWSICKRPDTALANDLQRFLSIAFCVTVPSRSRTFYDLRLGETFKEGVLTEQRFMSVEDLEHQGLWEQYKQEVRFYFHHLAKDYKTGKWMAPVMRESEGWWAELPNLSFGSITLYDYIRRWLTWGRAVQGEVNHNFFFRRCFSTEPIRVGDWNNRIKTMIQERTGVPVPPKNLRKIFATQFDEFSKSSAVLLQHSEAMQAKRYNMRHTVNQMAPVMNANTEFIQGVLSQSTSANSSQTEVIDAANSA